MRLVVQRVRNASVEVADQIVGAIEVGLLVFAGTTHADTNIDVDRLAEKLAGIRVFPDDDGKMNRSLVDVGGDVLLVSQFTVYGSVRKGKRPSFSDAGDPAQAALMIERLAENLAGQGVRVATGVFGASMQVRSQNDGPVTLILESVNGQIV